MLYHYIKLAIRYLAKQKGLALINILGLSIGLACFSLFMLYALHEFSYDGFHKKADRLFRVNSWFKSKDGREGGSAESPLALGPAMKGEFPEVEDFVRFQGGPKNLVRAGNAFNQLSLCFADPQIFSVFSFPLVNGDPRTALREPGDLVISREKAVQLFGSIRVLGRIIEVKVDSSFEPFRISAVAEHIPDNSSLRFDLLGNFERLASSEMGKAAAANWHMTLGIQTFCLLRSTILPSGLTDRLKAFRDKYLPDEKATAARNQDFTAGFVLQPLRAMHTSVNLDAGDPGSMTNPKNIWILIGIAAAVLLMGCINFTTLAIARSAGRSKEVGLRKVIGGIRRQLVLQFLTESLLLTFLAAGIGLLLAELFLPYFNHLSGKTLQFSFVQYPPLGYFLLLLVLLVGLLAGSYPALILSGFRPVEILNSKIRLGGSNFFTKSLVTLQFVLSIGLVIATSVILQQISFMRRFDLGFNKEHVIVVNPGGMDTRNIYPVFRQDMLAQAGVLGVAGETMGLGEGQGQMGGGYNINGKNCFALEYPVDPDYLQVMGIKLLAGRNFDPSIATDSSDAVIVNQTLVSQELKTNPDQVLGRRFREKDEPRGPKKTIIGVVRDFHFEPLTRAVRPQLFSEADIHRPEKFLIRIRPGDPGPVLEKMEQSWRKLAGGIPFSYSFQDENMDRFYKSEDRWSQIVGWAGGLSIFLASLGLFGLTSLAAVNRKKEVGIRKVLGAGAFSIAGLLSREFLRLVLVALLIAVPLSWILMHAWLNNYVYRISLNVGTFALTGFFALLIALLTTGWHSLKAASANPVKSLRTE